MAMGCGVSRLFACFAAVLGISSHRTQSLSVVWPGRHVRPAARGVDWQVPFMRVNNAHRPWPVPSTPWLMRMRWRELLFAHWQVDAGLIRPLLPDGLELDVFDGRCYVGAVPFLMEDTSPRFVPAVPGLHAFPELNLRTYV